MTKLWIGLRAAKNILVNLAETVTPTAAIDAVKNGVAEAAASTWLALTPTEKKIEVEKLQKEIEELEKKTKEMKELKELMEKSI